MPNISDYDSIGYDYTKYWEGRSYENLAEKKALEKLLPNSGDTILDVGGSFGRLAPIYTKRFKHATILDYSQIALDQAKNLAKQQKITNLTTAKGDAYDMPFENDSFDTVIIIRVMHHIEDPQKLIKELYRIIQPGGTLILEMANKIHLKARIRSVLKRDFSFIQDKTPIKLGASKEDPKKGIFYNFHPKAIQRTLEESGFSISKKLSVSNLRLPPTIKKKLPLSTLLLSDKMITPVFTQLNLGPSIWFKATKTKSE